MRTPLRATRVALTLLLTALGCGSEPSGSARQADSQDDGGDADGYVGCAMDPRVTAYAPGLSEASQDQAMKVTLVDSVPAPPIVGMNSWSVSVSDGTGAPIAGATITVSPYMPDHGHASPIVPIVTDEGGGQYSVAPLYFFMPGVWRVGFTVSASDAAPPRTVDFFFCAGG